MEGVGRAWSNSGDLMEQRKGCKIDSVNVGSCFSATIQLQKGIKNGSCAKKRGISAFFSTRVDERIFFWLLSWLARLS